MSGLDHKHFAGPEHGWEPEPGLPAPLPAGETQLWQGAPLAARVASEVFHLRAVAAYFAVLLLWKFAADWHDGAEPAAALWATLTVVPLPLLGLALLRGLAEVVARTTLYTLTNKRLVLRIGMVLSVTYNLPLLQIAAADVRRARDGSGDICLRLVEGQRIAFAHLWPHVRPWCFAHPQPSLRCLRDVDAVAARLSAAWSAVDRPQAPLRSVVTTASTGDGASGGRIEALAGAGHA